MSVELKPREPEELTDKSGERIRRMFGAISARYDFLNHLLSGGTDVYWRWRTVRLAPPQGDAPILDVCTGTGDLAFAYWRRGGRSIPVVGTDFTHEMLCLANEKRARRVRHEGDQQTCPIFLEADTLALPFADDVFQIVSVAFGLRNVSDTAGGIREMTRVCQPGGTVAVLEFSMPENRLLRSCYRWYFRRMLPLIGQLLARNTDAAYNYLPASVEEFPQGAALANVMESAGLESVRWFPFTFGIATLYVGRKPRSVDEPH